MSSDFIVVVVVAVAVVQKVVKGGVELPTNSDSVLIADHGDHLACSSCCCSCHFRYKGLFDPAAGWRIRLLGRVSQIIQDKAWLQTQVLFCYER